MNIRRNHVCHAVPPHILKALTKHTDPKVSACAQSTLLATEVFRTQRSIWGPMAMAMPLAVGTKRRTIYDAQDTPFLPGVRRRSEGEPATQDAAATEAYDGAGATYDFFRETFQRNSLDGLGMRLDSTVHYREDANDGYANAFWNGRQMVYGDGDGFFFGRFTASMDVIAHELTHGITEFTAGLVYEKQSGALNESMSDVFGTMVKQSVLGQKVGEADWLIGAELFLTIEGAMRSLKAPGTAYDDPSIGKDPQPAHMNDFQNLPNTRAGDWGGVHINSGIPNRAFYLSCVNLGAAYSWEKAGRIWYRALTSRFSQNSDFADAKLGTVSAAGELFGPTEADAVAKAWQEVGV